MNVQVWHVQVFKFSTSNSDAAGQAAKVGAAADRTERYSASVLSYVADYGTEAGFTEACETPILLLTTPDSRLLSWSTSQGSKLHVCLGIEACSNSACMRIYPNIDMCPHFSVSLVSLFPKICFEFESTSNEKPTDRPVFLHDIQQDSKSILTYL